MLIGLEGPVRAGKSYTAVKEHILEALKVGRRVYARLNGLSHEKIADYLKMPPERIEELLIIVPKDKVRETFVAQGDDPPRFKVERDSLIVIDEIQDYYPSGRLALEPEVEAFFAKHGHIGLDVVIMTQAIGRLHSAIRLRVERKIMFAKMNALGKEDRHVVRFFAVGDQMGKWVKVGSERRDYDPKIFPLYHGFQPGTENVTAYKGDNKTVWQVVKAPAIFMAIALAVGIFFVVKFFVSKNGMAEEKPAPKPAAVAPAPAVTGSVATMQKAPPPPQAKPLPPGIQYIVELMRTARPRYLGKFQAGDRVDYYVEFRAGQGQAMERMSAKQLEALGFWTRPMPYGLRAEGAGQVIIFTEWPIDLLLSQSSVTTTRIQAAGGALPVPTQEAQPAAADAAPSFSGALIGASGAHERQAPAKL